MFKNLNINFDRQSPSHLLASSRCRHNYIAPRRKGTTRGPEGSTCADGIITHPPQVCINTFTLREEAALGIPIILNIQKQRKTVDNQADEQIVQLPVPLAIASEVKETARRLASERGADTPHGFPEMRQRISFQHREGNNDEFDQVQNTAFGSTNASLSNPETPHGILEREPISAQHLNGNNHELDSGQNTAPQKLNEGEIPKNDGLDDGKNDTFPPCQDTALPSLTGGEIPSFGLPDDTERMISLKAPAKAERTADIRSCSGEADKRSTSIKTSVDESGIHPNSNEQVFRPHRASIDSSTSAALEWYGSSELHNNTPEEIRQERTQLFGRPRSRAIMRQNSLLAGPTQEDLPTPIGLNFLSPGSFPREREAVDYRGLGPFSAESNSSINTGVGSPSNPSDWRSSQISFSDFEATLEDSGDRQDSDLR